MTTSTAFRESIMMPDPANSDLVALAQRGNGDAVGALYDAHCPAVFRYFNARVGDQQIAEDLTGEVFRRMLTSLSRYCAASLPFRAWLFRIAHNLLVDHYRWASSHATVLLNEVENIGEEEVNPASVIEQKLVMEDAYHALAELEPPQRDVLALRFLSGLSLKETALVMGKTEDAVKALQRRGLVGLHLKLESNT